MPRHPRSAARTAESGWNESPWHHSISVRLREVILVTQRAKSMADAFRQLHDPLCNPVPGHQLVSRIETAKSPAVNAHVSEAGLIAILLDHAASACLYRVYSLDRAGIHNQEPFTSSQRINSHQEPTKSLRTGAFVQMIPTLTAGQASHERRAVEFLEGSLQDGNNRHSDIPAKPKVRISAILVSEAGPGRIPISQSQIGPQSVDRPFMAMECLGSKRPQQLREI